MAKGSPCFEVDKITNCSNPDCRRDLLKLSLTHIIKDKPSLAFCSRECRATVSKEEIRVVSKPEITNTAATAPSPKEKASKPAKATATPKEKGEKAPRASRSGIELTQKIFFTKKPPPKFQGNRKQVWDFIKDGMTVAALYALCDKAGVDGKGNLGTICRGYGCVEVR